MVNQPLISVIIPVYNVAQYLDASVESVLSQTYKNLDVILVNDGSSDNSGHLCDLWAQRDTRVRVIHQKNGGPSRARNAALDVAAGDYILFCDSDDLVCPDMCQVLYDSLCEDADIAICDYEHIFPDQPYAFSVTAERELLAAESVIRQMWYQTNFIPSACAKLYRRHIFQSHRFTPGLIFEDIDLLHELFWSTRKIAYNHSRLYGYVHRQNSITTTPFSSRDLDIFQVTDRILLFAKKVPALVDAAEAYTTAAALRIYLNAPRKPEYSDGIRQAEALLARYGKKAAANVCVRKKNRYALRLYFLCKPLLRFVYKHINRWK